MTQHVLGARISITAAIAHSSHPSMHDINLSQLRDTTNRRCSTLELPFTVGAV
jgi:hypothetical protein